MASQACGSPVAAVSLRANRPFMLVLGGQAVSAFGDAITLTAMPLLVLALTGSGAQMGLVGALQFLPDLLLGLPAGALADRMDRRRLMLWSDAGRAILTAMIPLAVWLGWPAMPVILLVMVPINAMRVLSDTALSSALPSLVAPAHLERANGLFEATMSVPFIVGPAVAGVLVGAIGGAGTIAIDAASFALSAAALAAIQRPMRAERPADMPRIVDDIREGIGFVWRDLALRLVIAYWVVVTAGTAALIPALGYFLIVDQEASAALFGFVGSAWSGGYLLGALASDRLGAIPMAHRMLAGGGVVGACLIAMTLVDAAWAYLVIGAVIGVALAIQTVSYMTLRPLLTPDALRGRVGSTSRTASAAVRPLGMLGGGTLLAAANGGAALACMGVLTLVASVGFSLSRTFRDAAPAEITGS